MAPNLYLNFVRQVAAIWLIFRVHVDAFLMFPARYLTATKWRVLGKRLRARGQFALLLSQSPRAYEFWALSEHQHRGHSNLPERGHIIALVRPNGSSALLDATLRSLAASGVEAVVISPQSIGRLELSIGHSNAMEKQWVMPINAGDLISPHANAAYASAAAKAGPSCTVIYADDDSLDSWGRCRDPHFKPSWNSELYSHHDFLTGACILRVDAAALLEAAQHEDWDTRLVGTALSRGEVEHIPKVLHHRRSRPAPQPVKAPPINASLPLVSVIIPTRNRVSLLRTCITRLRATQYPDLEIIIANNDSDDPETVAYLNTLASQGVRVLDQPGPFNYSTINNNAVAEATGELLCLMNNDVEMLAPDWLAVMATQALRPEVGAVGAQLLYPDGRIQHAGVVIGVGNAAGHAHRFLRPEAQGYFRRHALPQFVSAVTGACLVVRKDKFRAVGGLDEANFAVAFNDVDLCLKLNQRGWQSFYEPRAVLVHYESVSRGFDTDPAGAARFARELAALQRIWRTDEIVDPYHHPMLSRASEQFAIDLTSTMVAA